MRIVSGVYGGRKLAVPKGRDIRPTSDKIRGAVFNILMSRNAVDGTRVLDGYCGTGALGLEALSRGAQYCDFYDKSRDSLSLAKTNAEMLAVSEVGFTLKDTSKIGVCKTEPYNLVFLDPPYHKGLIAHTLDRLHQGQWLSQGAYILCESERSLALSASQCYEVVLEKTYGEIKIVLLRYQPIKPI